jgi:predicted transposase/invertase (TIGR01784 family)
MGNVNPRVDLAFKKIFGVEENKDLLISLINSILSAEDQVSDITLLNPYNPKNFKRDKLSILDIKAKSHSGKRFNIEVQISDEADYNKRALYYWGKLYTEQLKESDDYSKLSKAIGIHILNFTSIPESDKYHNVFHIREKDTGTLYFEDLELHTIELKKFTGHSTIKSKDEDEHKELAELVLKIKSSLDIWAAFLTRNDLLNKENLPKELENEDLKKALTVLEIMNFSEEEKEAYDDHLKWLRIETNTLKNYEQKGLEKGRAEGEQIGIEKGEQIGIDKRNREVALKMLARNKDDDEIMEFIGLTLYELNALKNMT